MRGSRSGAQRTLLGAPLSDGNVRRGAEQRVSISTASCSRAGHLLRAPTSERRRPVGNTTISAPLLLPLLLPQGCEATPAQQRTSEQHHQSGVRDRNHRSGTTQRDGAEPPPPLPPPAPTAPLVPVLVLDVEDRRKKLRVTLMRD